MKEKILEHLKLYLGLLLVSPLFYLFIALDSGINTFKTNMIVGITFLFLFIIGSLMLFYLNEPIYKYEQQEKNRRKINDLVDSL